MNRVEECFFKFIMILMTIAFVLLFSIAITGMIDSFTLEDIGEKSVPCIDEYNRPFEDEMCTKTITCSWLGFVADKKCALVALGESGGKDGE